MTHPDASVKPFGQAARGKFLRRAASPIVRSSSVERGRSRPGGSPCPRLLKVHDLGSMNLRLEDEAFGVHQDVALATLQLLAPVVTPIFSAHSVALHLPWESTTPALG